MAYKHPTGYSLHWAKTPYYIPEKESKYKREGKVTDYFVIPNRMPRRTMNWAERRYQCETPRPLGWVDISKITGPMVRKIDEGYIRQRLNIKTPEYNQSYIRKLLDNPRTPECNRQAAKKFVIDHPYFFLDDKSEFDFVIEVMKMK